VKRLLCVLALAACGRAPAAPDSARSKPADAQPKPVDTRPRLAGDAIAYRFVAHAGEAEVLGPDLPAAWSSLAYPAKIVSPYSGLRGAAAARVIELALADADVASYADAHAVSKRPALLPRFDPVWNRTRAVYESKTALFAPTGTHYRFAVPPVERGELRTFVATPPGAMAVEFRIEADGKPLVSRVVAESGTWVELRVEVNGTKQIDFVTDGPPTAAAWGDPLLIARDAGAPGPNLLLVVIDTLRIDALPVMPHLRALAARGARFDQAITAATWTRPSILALLGGDLPTALGQSAEEMIPSDADRRRFYAVAPPLLPRVLAGAGWQSVAIGNNFFLLGYPQIGLTLGFDQVADIRHPVLDTPAISRAAVDYLEKHACESFFLHLHYDAPHWPYTPPPEYYKRVQVPAGFPDDPMARAYLAEAAYADEWLGKVLDALDRLKLGERTLVMVVGDHGEVFDHAHSHTVEALGQPTLHHHGWSAYDELLRVPLVVALPGRVPPTHVAEQVSLIDLAPTALELLGLPPRVEARGRSLVPRWSAKPPAERPAYTEGQNVRAVRAGGWAYLRRSDARLTLDNGRQVRVDQELYDLNTDPREHKNRTGDATEALAKMRALFEAETPRPRDAPVSVLHLRVAPSERPRFVDGTLRTDGNLVVRAVAGAEASPLDAHSLRIALHGPAAIDLVVDPAEARLELSLRRDGTPLKPRDLLLGPFGLPLLADLETVVLDGERLCWLDAERPPVLGDRGEVLLWRDPSAITPLPAANAKSNQEVVGMMRRWGYAQPGK
jgi:arylsulfatase A-like enzyme